jgi:hypothetical protein
MVVVKGTRFGPSVGLEGFQPFVCLDQFIVFGLDGFHDNLFSGFDISTVI